MATFISRSPEETLALGRAWGESAVPGWVVGLSGDLGAGKTQLVKGIALGLGVTARVHSPTFAIVCEYTDGRMPLAHLDLYRLETRAALREAGLEDYLIAPRGVVVVEWFERWLDLGLWVEAARVRRVQIETINANERRICYGNTGT